MKKFSLFKRYSKKTRTEILMLGYRMNLPEMNLEKGNSEEIE
jgi:hypothetical protein